MFSRLAILVGVLCGVVSATQYSTSDPVRLTALFDSFKSQYGRAYITMSEEMTRYKNFVATLSLIDSRNALENGKEVHGITQFADMTQFEFESMYLHKGIASNIRGLNATRVQVPKYTGPLTAVDYTGKQTTAIKNQGSCGSCWAHACAEQIESDGMRLLGNPASKTLSVQQLVSCDHGDGQLGCGGGLQETGFDYVRVNGGITTDSEYPYTSSKGGFSKCDKSKSHYVMGVTSYKMILDGDVKSTEASFTNYALSTGTISIGVDATTWNTYKGGIMSNCGKGTDINHSVQIVGVDTSGSWKIRNSWGEDWGENGFIRVTYGANTCGLVTEGGSYTTVYNI